MKLFSAFVIASALLVSSLSAATLVLDGVTTITATPASPTSLTSAGDLDWAYWTSGVSSGLVSPLAPTNDRATGGTIIGDLSNVGGTALRGSSSTTYSTARFSYTDGASPTSNSDLGNLSLIFNGSLGSSAVNNGVSFTITGDPLADRYVNLYLGGFSATGKLTLTLNGATTLTDSSQIYPGGGLKQVSVFSIHFRPGSASDLLNVSYVASAVSDTTLGHVGVQAATVSAVPEPGVAVSLLGGMGLVFLRRRRA